MSLAVAQCGSGADLVLVHGWGLHGKVWSPLVDALSTQYRLHIIDLPGHGASLLTADHGNQGGWVQALAQSVPTPATWLGWSLGGLLTLQMARRFPRQVQRVIVVGTSPCFVQRTDWQAAMSETRLRHFMRDLQEDYAATIRRFLSLQMGQEPEARNVVRQLHQHLAELSPDPIALAKGLLLLRETDLRARLKDIQQPVLVIQGVKDQLVPLSAAEYLARHLPRGRLLAIDRAGHVPFLSHQTEVQTAIRRFTTTEHDHAGTG